MIVLCSFLLDGILSNYINNLLLTITAITIISSKKNYYKTSFLYGLLYDIAYTNTLFINGILFMIIVFITKKINYYFTNNIISNTITILTNIIFYRISIYIILVLSKTVSFNIVTLFESIYLSIFNLIYGYFIYILIKRKTP